MKKIILIILLFVILIYAQRKCRCKYNQSLYYDCCEIYEEELAIKKYSDDDIYELLIIGLINLTINVATSLVPPPQSDQPKQPEQLMEDRKSTRLNSSHVSISYAVFCLKKN